MDQEVKGREQECPAVHRIADLSTNSGSARAGRAPGPTRAGGQYITGFPVFDLLVVHKVNIDQDEGRNITEPTFMTMLDLVLDAKSKWLGVRAGQRNGRIGCEA